MLTPEERRYGLLTSIASLGLVITLLAGVLWWLRRLAPRAGAGRHIQVVESVTLGPGQALHLVRLAGRGLLVASTRERCELLCELDAPSPEEPSPASWRELLAARGGRK